MNNHSKEPSGPATRGLVRRARTAALGTQLVGANRSYTSLVLCATDHGGQPILHLSSLAEHTKNIQADAQVSLLIDGTAGHKEPLTGPRVTLMGRATRIDDLLLIERYLRRFPSARSYAAFSDFSYYRVSIERGHLVAGFGQIEWLDAAALCFDCRDAVALAEHEAEIVDHMNEDHADAIGRYADRLLELPGDGWHLTGCDPEGCDLASDDRFARLNFGKSVNTPEEARAEFVRLAKAARHR